MTRLIMVRLLQMVPVVLGATVLAFLLLNLLPGDVAYTALGPNPSPDSVAAVRAELHLDEPLQRRYFEWLVGLLHGDLGRSLYSRDLVTALVLQRLPVTIELILLAQVLSLTTAVPAALTAARRPGTWLDRSLGMIAFTGVSTPGFLFGLILILVLAVRFGMLPATGFVPLNVGVRENLTSMLLPCATLAFSEFAVYFRILRTKLIEQFGEEYVTMALARGLSRRRVTLRHVLPNSIINLITVLGLHFAALLGGAVVIETLFALPGEGQLLITSIYNRDLVVVQGVVLVAAVGVVLANLLVDVIHHAVDPRVRA